MKKRILAVVLTTVLLMSVFAGCGNAESDSPASDSAASQESTQGESEEVGDLLFDKVVEISMVIPSHSSYPYSEDWGYRDIVKEYTNVELDITPVINEEYDKKTLTIVAGAELPDLMYLQSNSLPAEYGPQGAFINLLDYMDQMPNFKAWAEANPDRLMEFVCADGAIYMAPEQGIENYNRRGWIYRQDVFEELGLKVPTNQDEFYDVLVKLKEAYPDSYPLSFRSMASASYANVQTTLAGWGTEFIDPRRNCMFTYDYETGEWTFGPTSQEYRDYLAFYNKLYEEELLIPNYLSIDTAGWIETMATDTSFITYDYLSRTDSIALTVIESDPTYKLAWMAPPTFGSSGTGQAMWSATGMYGFAISAQSKQLDEVLAYVDWLYTDEASDLLCWGRPGEYYTENADGSRTWIDEFKANTDRYAATGFGTYGTYLRYNTDAYDALISDSLKSYYAEAALTEMRPQPTLAYNSEELELYNTLGVAVITHVYSEMHKFLLGERSLDEWDTYVDEINAIQMNGKSLADLQKIHEDAYNRQLAAGN